ncbi:AlwI family type II restriction endonuclease [Larkinella terrae]|uniref:AlwI family type II restriction endonuclease n=1 Tax=Larkinella terrae TaxID=2025311 RepID=UPI00197D3909|nr:AlwI family type II restriction endonuclease [Larkinella terrae]
MIALQASPLNGSIIGKPKELEFSELLHNSEIAVVKRYAEGKGEDYSDIGRKWRSALMQLGFITPKLNNKTESGDADPELLPVTDGVSGLSGRPYEITPNGYRLINADVIAGQQECFLRSLSAYQIPSPIEQGYRCPPFSPLKFVIDILFEIKHQGGEAYISFDEYALFIQTSSPDIGIPAIAATILDYRTRRAAHAGQMRKFDREELTRVIVAANPGIIADKINTKGQTLDDYADLSLRYLKATGIFRSKGRGISIAPIKEELTQLIHEAGDPALAPAEYLINLWNGAKLPTDDVPAAEKVVNDLIAKIRAKGKVVTPLTPGEDVSQKRHALEEQLRHLDEEEYYHNQPAQIDEILAWIDALLQRPATFAGERIVIPNAERPAYFEWAIWRAFLAINSLVNAPWNARRFQIDQDFLPVGTAPGNGPDMVFEFPDAIIVVEVTFTSSSRQEAAEGEPVRRHVAKYAVEHKDTGKPVYGLFLAINIDSNTANTYRSGDWYMHDDSKLNLHIVPIRLDDFQKLLSAGKANLPGMRHVLKDIIKQGRMDSHMDAPAWKKSISQHIEQTIRGLV